MTNAVSLADELRKAFGISTKLIPSSNGIFDVVIDGKCVFSKSREGRFPESGEIIEKLKLM